DYAAPQSDAKFGVTARMAPCPWNPGNVLLTLGVRAADAPEAGDEGSNLVFLVDVSGSMYDDNKLPLAQKALSMLVDELGEKDTVSIVTYASGEDILIEGANPIKDKAKLLSAIDALVAEGSTNGQRGLAQAYEVAQRYLRPKGNNRVIMCSDGDLNVGITSESDLHDFVTEKKQTGIYLSVLGFGDGNYKDTKMETLADDGNGNYYYIDSILEARKVLCEELTQTLYAVADDVKFQVEFNPAKVSAWRQIGYENRALENQDFEDDKKDAGEVGAGACVTVMYELVPAGESEADGSLKYQTSTLTEAAQGGEWLTLSTRYKEPGGETSQLQTDVIDDTAMADAPEGDFRFAAAVAEFGMILADSAYKGDASYDTVLDLLKQAPLNDPYREELFSLVKIAQRNAALNE
ncbi:MAG: YfbK domain-containing protein, partial [Eubacteriales bacterium]